MAAVSNRIGMQSTDVWRSYTSLGLCCFFGWLVLGFCLFVDIFCFVLFLFVCFLLSVYSSLPLLFTSKEKKREDLDVTAYCIVAFSSNNPLE